jgi:TPR repeat protein
LLGTLYENGTRGFTKDILEGIRWYTLAANQGNAEAQTRLAVIYLNGVGVEPNRELAVKYVELAAAQGYRNAIYLKNNWF